jgi:alpha-glucosidase (family GH31 glycosyl hydrolase)
MHARATTIAAGPDEVRMQRGALSLQIVLRPFAFRLARAGHTLLRSGGLWAADGVVRDLFIHMTEGIIASEELAPPERAVRAGLSAAGGRDAVSEAGGHARSDAGEDRGPTNENEVQLALRLDGGRLASLRIGLVADDLLSLELSAEGEPLRLALDWDRRSGERFVGLGARHGTQLDQSGRAVALGADRRYTGPDCPAEMLAIGGIPQGDCAPLPWVSSSRGYSVWILTAANGTRFDFSGERTSVSTRTLAGPLRVHVLCEPTPAARLRSLCRATGFPALMPEWGYGFWKSRDIHEHQDDVLDDFDGFRRHGVALDAIVIDSPWATQYNSWEFNHHQFPNAPWMIQHLRAAGVRTVLWCTPWVNLDSRDGQIPPQAASERLHREPAPNYEAGAQAGHFVSNATGNPLVTKWWMGTGSLVDFTSAAAERWWREQVKQVLALGVQGIKMDDGDGYYVPDDARLADGRRGAQVGWELGSLHRRSLQRALDEVHPGDGVLFGRSGWSGQQAQGFTWAADQASDFWSLGALVTATLSAAASGFSNWSHDVGGYLGHRLVERCPPELLVRWLQFGCFTPLMHAHSRMPQEPWNYGGRVLDTYRAYVLLHERLVPYVRAAAATAARTGLPIIRPLCLSDPADPRGWTITDAYGYGPALWVAPVLQDGVREREVALPRGDWIETWSGARVRGGGEVVVPAPLNLIPVWVRAGSIVVSYPAAHVTAGLGDVPESKRPLEATLWGEPPLGHATARLADGTRLRWRRGEWSLSDPARQLTTRVIDA